MTFFRLCLRLVAACGLIASGAAQAAITCSLSSSGFSSAYVPANPGNNVTTASVSVTCTRGNANDATSETVSVRTNNGANQTANGNRGESGGNFIFYDAYTNASCSTIWRNNNTALTVIVDMVGLTSSTRSVSYWGCIPPGQTTVPAGTYTDTVTMKATFSNSTTVGPSADPTFPVSIVTPSSCNINASLGNLTFNYASFQTAAASPSLAFTANCTNRLPYSMALDATAGVSLGLAYSLSLSATSGVGNGTAQSYTVNGSMLAGQAGSCATGSCTSNTPRTLTITY